MRQMRYKKMGSLVGILLLTLLVALPFLAWCVPDLDTELNRTTEKASRLKPPTTTERAIPEIHERVRAENISWNGFYRKSRHKTGDSRRVLAGKAADLMDYAAACVLLDQNYNPACTAAIVAPRWVITAGHCLNDGIIYVKYNTQHPISDEGNVSRVLHLYRHPDYRVERKDEGLGMGVFLLHHDVGLVHVQDNMVLRAKLRADPLIAMRRYSPAEMNRKELQVIGFGRRGEGFKPKELVSTKLRMTYCYQEQWIYCICGVTKVDIRNDSGICSGDSGGPVLFLGVQVAVTSMGPTDCQKPNTTVRAIPVTVFTNLYHYADMINATIRDAKDAPRMVMYASHSDKSHSAKSHSDKSHLSRSVFGLAVLLLICSS